jgi:hypothetical protein
MSPLLTVSSYSSFFTGTPAAVSGPINHSEADSSRAATDTASGENQYAGSRTVIAMTIRVYFMHVIVLQSKGLEVNGSEKRLVHDPGNRKDHLADDLVALESSSQLCRSA